MLKIFLLLISLPEKILPVQVVEAGLITLKILPEVNARAEMEATEIEVLVELISKLLN